MKFSETKPLFVGFHASYQHEKIQQPAELQTLIHQSSN